ncbi:lathosterol oxidase-like [Patiria miniata]|uniref:Fatty acid hydroxylase domain-containing protein n=1 Tax=Patiria miniata TaxID=46514 RepID=A0A914B310_PATMI|nr:lathosterol oxidase-like [Patiria miniata]XP_038070298.1 lathosterol oxidase-like [Patiria miniata]XP_038070299.1 lathosterol oxidase-like [Patiria miniata]
MDIVLNVADDYFFDKFHVYPQSWSNDLWIRQVCSLYVLTCLSGVGLYLASASFNYFLLFDRRLEKHPLFLKNQIRREIETSVKILPVIAVMTVGMFFVEVRGYSKLFDGIPSGELGWLLITRDILGFIFFTDCAIYWIHRWMHNRLVYKHVHKMHHIWKVPTPFASHAFHPIDGFLQSLPYHLYPFLFPLNKYAYLVLFVLVNVWTISIHDGDYRVPAFLRPFINGSAHHTDHHLYYNYNYGQYFTLWDRIGGSFKTPSAFEGKTLVEEIMDKERNGKNHVD